jgi:hypothetical protein
MEHTRKAPGKFLCFQRHPISGGDELAIHGARPAPVRAKLPATGRDRPSHLERPGKFRRDRAATTHLTWVNILQ